MVWSLRARISSPTRLLRDLRGMDTLGHLLIADAAWTIPDYTEHNRS